MANPAHLGILRQGVEVWNRWRQKNPDIQPNLARGNLIQAQLPGVNLIDADLLGAVLIGVILTGGRLGRANLNSTHLAKADLEDTDLTSASLTYANLTGARLNRANLSGGVLYLTNLNGAQIRETDLSFCKMQGTLLADVDLSTVKGLDTIIHAGPSTIGIDTIYRSKGNIPEVFLRGAGVPDQFIEYARSLITQPILYYSCFISHSSKDQSFCDRIYADLQANHLRVWYFPEDATWGKTVWGEIDGSIRFYDKLLLVCSAHSLQSGPVLREIERALQREDQEGKNVLFPIDLDGWIFDKWEHERKADVLAKVVGDFRGWDTDARSYETSLNRLLRALQEED